MSIRISAIILLCISIFYKAAGEESLTKEEARKQLERHINEYLYHNFYLDTYIKKNSVFDNLNALKKAGYIDLVSTKAAGSDALETKTLPKAKPIFVREENNKLFFKVATVDIKITSIKKQLPGKKGRTIYRVEYLEKITRNHFLELWGITHCFDGKEYPTHATLTQTPTGWDVDHQYFY